LYLGKTIVCNLHMLCQANYKVVYAELHFIFFTSKIALMQWFRTSYIYSRQDDVVGVSSAIYKNWEMISYYATYPQKLSYACKWKVQRLQARAGKENIHTLAVGVRIICTLKACISNYLLTTLRLHDLPGNWARELFKTLKDATSLLVCIEKNWKVLDFNSSIASPRYIRGCCLMLERQYGFRAGAWVGRVLFQKGSGWKTLHDRNTNSSQKR